jgi:hypothetical protein
MSGYRFSLEAILLDVLVFKIFYAVIRRCVDSMSGSGQSAAPLYPPGWTRAEKLLATRPTCAEYQFPCCYGSYHHLYQIIMQCPLCCPAWRFNGDFIHCQTGPTRSPGVPKPSVSLFQTCIYFFNFLGWGETESTCYVGQYLTYCTNS